MAKVLLKAAYSSAHMTLKPTSSRNHIKGLPKKITFLHSVENGIKDVFLGRFLLGGYTIARVVH